MRTWPMLALLVLVVAVAVACVLWFMREAMKNERLAVREKLTEAYRGHLALARKTVEERWDQWRRELESPGPAPVQFERCVSEGLADSVICLDAKGDVIYPETVRAAMEDVAEAEKLGTELRALAKGGNKEAIAEFVWNRLANKDSSSLHDAQGRHLAANAELMALEQLGDSSDSRFVRIAERLRRRLLDYSSHAIPAAQRRFLMRELQQLVPGAAFPTQRAEELAARYLDIRPSATRDDFLQSTTVPELWVFPSASRRLLALVTTDTLRRKFADAIRENPSPAGIGLAVLAPGEESKSEGVLIDLGLGTQLPGWRVLLALEDRALFETAADQRARRYLIIAGAVIAGMSMLAMTVARTLRRQVQLARLKNDLVANVSHELKTPLTAMRALVDTLLDAPRLDETTTREYLHLLAKENARLSRLIENFLTFSRLERNKFTFSFGALQPSTVIAGALAALGERGRTPGCVVETKVADDLPSIHGDSDALVTALLNLLDNACKYSGENKHIVVRAERHNGSVRFAVIDNGFGLSPSESRRVFGRFYQTNRRLSGNSSGCGLGLNIVQSIVRAHGGAVHVASELGRGSTFTIDIPVSEEGAP